MGSERKVAVITGASQGIGAGLVQSYRDRNYAVVATARSIRPTDDGQIPAVPGDISDRKTAERAMSGGLARFGRIDALINNAGVFIARPFTQYTEVDYEPTYTHTLVTGHSPFYAQPDILMEIAGNANWRGETGEKARGRIAGSAGDIVDAACPAGDCA
jgi:NAD(P)-dependent dehydrogenase (short-subunit alcohol dehydrogenase family)